MNYVEYGKENKYDDNIFFQKYSQMSRSQQGLAGAGEWETLRELLPDFKERQDRQQPYNANAQERRFAGAFPRGYAASAQVGEHGNDNRDRQHRRHRQRVKYPAGRQQKRALPALRQMQVDGGHDQQKAEKSKTLQAHGRTSPL